MLTRRVKVALETDTPAWDGLSLSGYLKGVFFFLNAACCRNPSHLLHLLCVEEEIKLLAHNTVNVLFITQKLFLVQERKCQIKDDSSTYRI